MKSNKNIIDSHVHLDLIEHHQPDRISWLKQNNCCVISWSYFEKIDSVSHLEECLKSKVQCIQRHSADGLICYFLAGIHPRSIPQDLTLEQIPSLLKSHLQNPRCRGIGEIGLETANVKEQEVFIAQLELGRRLLNQGTVIGVHTPRNNKLRVTQTTLDILHGFSDMSSSLVVDHCTVETIGAVLDAGFWAGVTLSPIKTSWDEMIRIVSLYPDRIDRIMCNTDSGRDFFEDAARFSRAKALPDATRRKLFYGNAAHFFAINEHLIK